MAEMRKKNTFVLNDSGYAINQDEKTGTKNIMKLPSAFFRASKMIWRTLSAVPLKIIEDQEERISARTSPKAVERKTIKRLVHE